MKAASLQSVLELETKPPVEPTANKEFELVPKMRPLSKESLEVLAVMAYRQPVSLADINTLRKVSSIGPLQTLRRRGLVVSNKTGKNGEMLWSAAPSEAHQWSPDRLGGSQIRHNYLKFGDITTRTDTAVRSKNSFASSLFVSN